MVITDTERLDWLLAQSGIITFSVKHAPVNVNIALRNRADIDSAILREEAKGAGPVIGMDGKRHPF